jgi:hypothetical protein
MDVILYNKIKNIEKKSGFNWINMVFNNIEPVNNAIDIDASTTIILEPYIMGFEHDDTNIQIATDSLFSNLVLDYTAGTPITSYDMPTDNLNTSTQYFWRYRYKDSYRGWCKFSEPTSFTTSISFFNYTQDEIGQPHGGGYFAGIIDTTSSGGIRYAVICSPRASGDTGLGIKWKLTSTTTLGTTSKWDGWTNTNNMNNSTHPAAQFTRLLTINGYDDWYLPAVDELELCYRHFKPTSTNNYTDARTTPYGQTSGYNPSSDPIGNSYNISFPAQTSITNFIDGNSEAFNDSTGYWVYWTSTEYNSGNACDQRFNIGRQYNDATKSNSYGHARAIRRILL